MCIYEHEWIDSKYATLLSLTFEDTLKENKHNINKEN